MSSFLASIPRALTASPGRKPLPLCWGSESKGKREMDQQMECVSRYLHNRNSSCDSELQELMHQIDIMVHSKKSQWDRKVKSLESTLEIRDQEIVQAQRSVEQTAEEMGNLRQELESAEKSQNMIVEKYEGQLHSMRLQLRKLQNTYEKLQLHTVRQAKFHYSESATDNLQGLSNITKLNQKIEEFKVKSKEWEKQRQVYENQLASLTAQQDSLVEKCELFQKESQTYHAQLTSQRHFLDEAILCSQTGNRSLKCQLDSSQEAIRAEELIIENLKIALSEVTTNRDALQKENQQLIQDLKKSQGQGQKLEAELSSTKVALRSQEDLLHAVELEHKNLEKEVAKCRTSRTTQEHEKSLESAHALCLQLREELANKKQQLHIREQEQANQEAELAKTRTHLYQQEQFRGLDAERAKTGLSDLNDKLHQKDITIATIIKDAGLLEKQLKAELEIKDNQLSKQQVSTMSHELLQRENKQLKERIQHLETSHTMDLKSFKDQQENYAVCISFLQDKNASLHKDLETLQYKLEMSLEAMQKHSGALRDARHDLIQLKTKDRTFQPEDEWKLIGTMDDMSDYTTKGSSRARDSKPTLGHGVGASPPERLCTSIAQVAEGLQSCSAAGCQNHQKNSLTEPDMIHMPDTSCIPDVSDILLDSVYSKGDSSTLSSRDMSLSAAEQFLHEEEKRANEFEKMLGSHINELHKNSEKTLAKYTRLL